MQSFWVLSRMILLTLRWIMSLIWIKLHSYFLLVVLDLPSSGRHQEVCHQGCSYYVRELPSMEIYLMSVFILWNMINLYSLLKFSIGEHFFIGQWWLLNMHWSLEGCIRGDKSGSFFISQVWGLHKFWANAI